MKNNSLVALLALLIGLASGLRAQSDELAPVTRTFALQNVHIVTQPGEVIEMGTLVIKDGLIHAVGKNVTVPANAKVLDADSMFVYAGFIEALSHTGVPKPESDNDQGRGRYGRPQGVIPGQPTNEQAGITPEKKVSDLVSEKEKSIADMRKLGFTAAHVVPEGRMLPGQGAIILLGGGNAHEMVLFDETSVFSQLASARGVFPATVIGVMSKWRELYRQAQQAQAHETMYKLDPKGMPRPEYDPALQAFYPVLDGDKPVFFVANDIKDIHRVLKLKEDLAFPLVLAEVQEGWHAADKIKSMNIPVLLSLELPDAPKKDGDKKKEGEEGEKEEEAAEKTMADKEREMLETRRAEAMEKYLAQAAVMAEKGIAFGFSTLEVKSGDIKANLRRMIEKGLSEDQALAALTTIPAKMLGLSGMMGTVEEGKIANLVVSTDAYFSEDANVRYVFVDGALYEYEARKKKAGDPNATANPVGSWTYTIESPQGTLSGTLTITRDGAGFGGSMSSSMAGTTQLSNVELSGNNLSFSTSFDAGGQSVSLTYDLVISGDAMEGTVAAGSFGTFDIEGERTSGPERR